MTPEHFETILKQTQAKEDKEDKDDKSDKSDKAARFKVMPEGTTLTLHIAHDGATLAMPRVEAIRRDGDLVWARNGKKELCAVVVADVFAVLIEGAPGTPARRAGFGS
jgi:hypothetical protein